MAGRSFEELAREEMERLRIKPEESVWQHLAATLEQKKKKRWVFWLFFAGIGCLFLSTTWYFLSGSDLSTGPQQEISAPSIAPPVRSGNTELETEIPLDAPIQVLKGLQAGNFRKEEPGTEKNKQAAVLTKEIPVATVQAPNKQETEEQGKITENSAIAQEVISSGQDKVKADSARASIVSTKRSNDSSLTSIRIEDAASTTIDPGQGNKEEQPAIRKPITSRWQWSLSVTAGSSGMRTGIGKMPEYPVALSANIPAFPGATGSWRTPSLRDAGSFGLNIEFAKLLRKYAGISLLVAYQLYQTQTGVGRNIDSSVPATAAGPRSGNGVYYLSTDSVTYLNHFHFLQAGISGYLQRRISAKMQLRWNLGTAAAILLKSNALHYDATVGILYTNNALVNRIQWNLFSSFELGLGKDPLFYIGPEWSWFVTTPYQSTVNANQHLFRYALKARVVLGHKNRR
ncbi:MAG: hypothetical protein IM584_01410 [Chitinophagaceae bacterium]|nr:hypothetical protein [Chitinophagaceae bacterium]MCA6452614.1 hypothetical protein [Chitinophagaceae bacterium]MCA6454770.1 hypothetical protein [Chitinophagaceae bacterium]MCA6459437.1 hypothetical protein [Chitinophagaceae bacterium]MCA6464759.1 hypothetical protein [Chitinophagaceae bacterium]